MNNTAIRNIYMWRFSGRILVLICCAAYCLLRPAQLKAMEGMEFFKEFTLLHVLWIIWMIDILFQLVPAKVKISIGSQKNFKKWFRPADSWDHFMMFTPFLFIPGFFTWSLLGLAVLVMVIWEVNILNHPERFWEVSSDTLKCANCTDKLCTQYCSKLPKRIV